GKTIQFGDRLTRPYGGILNNHVAKDEPSIRGTGLISTRGTYDIAHHVLGETIQHGDRLAEPHGRILNNHVTRDKSSNRKTKLTNTYNRIINTRTLVTSPTRANYPAKGLW
ncbi:unnamed protein product, partial [Prunus brigantina]